MSILPFLVTTVLAFLFADAARAQVCGRDADAIFHTSTLNAPASIDANGIPVLGNPAFEISVALAPGACVVNGDVGALLFAFAPAQAPTFVPFGGCTGGPGELLVQPQIGLALGLINGPPPPVLTLAIPSSPSACSFRFSAQAVILDSSGVILLGNALEMVIGDDVT